MVIYIDSTLFVFVTAIISKGLGINESIQICEGAILLCTDPRFPLYYVCESNSRLQA